MSQAFDKLSNRKDTFSKASSYLKQANREEYEKKTKANYKKWRKTIVDVLYMLTAIVVIIVGVLIGFGLVVAAFSNPIGHLYWQVQRLLELL